MKQLSLRHVQTIRLFLEYIFFIYFHDSIRFIKHFPVPGCRAPNSSGVVTHTIAIGGSPAQSSYSNIVLYIIFREEMVIFPGNFYNLIWL